MTASKVLINSLPKSGTHLLAKAIELFNYQEHFAEQQAKPGNSKTPLFLNYREVRSAMAKQSAARQQSADIAVGTLTPAYVDAKSLESWLAAMPDMTYLLGHMGFHEQLPELLLRQQIRHIFIIRDPRAVLASLLEFILDTRGMPKPHFLEADFVLLDQEQRLELLLSGGYAPSAGLMIKPFADIFYNMLAWQDKPGCLLIKFEDLVGEQGGGNEQRQQQALKKIAEHLGQSFDMSLIRDDQNAIYSAESRTFRQGSAYGWQKSLDGDSLERIQDYCRPLCRMAGYLK